MSSVPVNNKGLLSDKHLLSWLLAIGYWLLAIGYWLLAKQSCYRFYYACYKKQRNVIKQWHFSCKGLTLGPKFRHSLSLKLLRVVLLAALLVGLVLGCAQIVLNIFSVKENIATEAQRISEMFLASSTQAAYDVDKKSALRVVEGLLKNEAVRHAAIVIGDAQSKHKEVLAEKQRDLSHISTRWLTDPILGREKEVVRALKERMPGEDESYYGDLEITLDTAFFGKAFIYNSIIILTSGILRSLVLGVLLYLIYHWMLTRPIARLVRHLSSIDPNHPGERLLPTPRGYEQSELGIWVNTANQLLYTIERNSRLRREAETSLQRMAKHDFLTGLPNRQQLQQRLDSILVESRRNQRKVAVLCVGLDDFKSINEQYSYQNGDRLLLALADRLRANEDYFGSLARLGGDQFALVQADIEHPYEAAELAQLVLDGLEAPFALEGKQTVRLRATIGITLFPQDGDSAEVLLQRAEHTMTLAKSYARSGYQFYIASVDSKIRKRRRLEKDLREALDKNQLSVVFQPQVAYPNRRVVGVEALLRWKHPQHGWVPPNQFIPLAEQNGLIIPISDWALEQCCKQLQQWHNSGFDGLRMAINLSTVQLRHAGLPQIISRLMQDYQLPRGALELEVTETTLMEDITAAARHLRRLRESGALIAIDDFGTGYSSLNYLRSLPLDKIKIDKSFVQDVLDDEDDATIVRTIIQLGKNLGMQVIAEGVETHEQEAYIIAQGCHEGQGYLYSKPMPAEAVASWIKQADSKNAKARD